MHTFKYEDIIDITLKRFPEFRDSEEYKIMGPDEVLPYIFYGWFKAFIMKKIETNGENDPTVKKFIAFLNEIFNDPNADPKSLELLQLEILDPLTIPEKNVVFMKKNLKGKALERYEMVRLWKPKKKIKPLSPKEKKLIRERMRKELEEEEEFIKKAMSKRSKR